MHLLTDPFASQFVQRALIGGLIVATITALVGTWVVVRGLAFFGDAVAHGVLPGLALAAVWGFSPTVGALASALVMVLGINLVQRSTRLSDDTSTGLLFVGMLALGVIILSLRPSFSGDLTNLLFGNILGVRTADIWVGLAGVAVTIVVLVAGHRSFLALAMSDEKASALGLRPRLANAVLLVLLAGSVVVSFRAVGTLLVFGFLIAPPATAILIVNRLPLIMVVGVVDGWIAVFVGLIVSYYADTAASATIAGLAVAQFFVVLTGVNIANRITARRATGRGATPALS